MTPVWQREHFTQFQEPMLDSFSCSFTGKLVRIEYTLEILVKHDAWNSWGEGKLISLPIIIMQAPI